MTPLPSDLKYMALQTNVLYELDHQHRLLRVNEPGAAPAPRLFIGRTTTGDLWRFRSDLAASLIQSLTALQASEPPATDLRQLPRCMPALTSALASEGMPPAVWHGPAWRFPDTLPAVPPDVVRIHGGNAALLAHTFPDHIAELSELAPCFAVVHGHEAVAICFSARTSASAAEAGVETLGSHRGNGYAPIVTLAWAAAVRQEGRIPLYSTAWDNVASRAVARKLGLILYGADLSFT